MKTIFVCKKCSYERNTTPMPEDGPLFCPNCGTPDEWYEVEINASELPRNELIQILIEIKAAIETGELIPNPDLFRTPSNYVRVLNLLTKINRAVYSSEVDIKT